MNDLTVSVFMITYNHGSYIAKAIESALSQQINFNYEIVVGEDCSIDDTKNIVSYYAEKYPDIIKVVTADINVGMIENFKRTHNACRGKYISFLDGDDFWHNPLKLQKQVDFLELYAEYDMVHSDVNIINTKNKYFIKNFHNKNKFRLEKMSYENLLIENRISICTVCMRKESLTKCTDYGLYKEKNWKMIDFPIWLEILNQGKIGYIDEALATYRILYESASHSKDAEKLLNFFKSFYDIKFFFITKYGCREDTKKKVIQNYHRGLLRLAFLVNDKDLARTSFNILYSANIKLHFREYLFFWGTLNQKCMVLLRFFYFVSKKIKRLFINQYHRRNVLG